MPDAYWGPLKPDAIVGTRAPLTWGLRPALFYYSELCVPGIGGVSFVRQLSWAVTGIDLHEQCPAGRPTDVANAIEALGCKLGLTVGYPEELQWRIRGSRRLPNLTDWSFETLRRPTNYVVIPFRRSTTRALSRERGLGFTTGGTRFNSMELTNAGRSLAVAFLQQSGKGAPEQKGPGRWLKEWLQGRYVDRPYGLTKLATQLGACFPSQEERNIVRKCVLAETSPNFPDRERRRRLALFLSTLGNGQISDIDKQLFDPLRQTGDGGVKHVLDMETALAFQKMREAALAVVISAMQAIADPERGQRIVDLCAAIKCETELLRDTSNQFLKAGTASGSLHPDAKAFANAMSGEARNVVSELARLDGKVLLGSGSRILGGAIFRAFKQRYLNQALPGEDDFDEEHSASDPELPFRIWNFHHLLMDCAP